jgi:hypothetical protein
VLNCRGRRVLWCAPVSPRFRESVPRLYPAHASKAGFIPGHKTRTDHLTNGP